MLFVILGVLLLLIPVLLLAFVTRPTLKTEEFQQKGFGDRWSRRETFAFFLLLVGAATGGVLLLVPFVAGSLLLAYGVASIGNASLPYTFLSEGIAFVSSLLLWWVYLQWRGNEQITPSPSVITQASSLPVLLFNTSYTFDKLTVTIHALRKRRSFRPIAHPSVSEGQIQPETWFIEFDCTLKNRARKEALIWAQLEEVLPEYTEPHAPLRLRQSIPLSEDEAADREIGSNTTLSSARYSIVVKDTVESKMFFKLNESMNVHTMAFSLHLSRKNQEPCQKLLFTVEV
ncbi:MAG TPA: hypothetical protein VF043_10345 [Ktedonobacteraceae bacterium]